MRTSLITSVIAASVLTVGLAGGVVQAGNSDPAAPPDTIPGMDMLSGLGLTPEQTQCLVDSAGDLDLEDMNAIMGLMTECGIDPMALVAGGATTPEPVVGTETSVVDDAAAIDPDTAAAVLTMLGVDPTSAQCIADGLLAADAGGTDEDSLLLLQDCGLTLNDLLAGVVALNELAAGSADATATTEVGAPTLSTEVGSPTTAGEGIASDNPMVTQIQDMLSQQGIELDEDQVSCLVDNVGDLDPSDAAAAMAVFESCGISLTDLS